MPTIDYLCQNCDHAFRALSFRGDETGDAVCPVCGSHGIKPEPKPEGVFDGISNFSSLAGDSNLTR